jgi:hypothetical protein
MTRKTENPAATGERRGVLGIDRIGKTIYTNYWRTGCHRQRNNRVGNVAIFTLLDRDRSQSHRQGRAHRPGLGEGAHS